MSTEKYPHKNKFTYTALGSDDCSSPRILSYSDLRKLQLWPDLINGIEYTLKVAKGAGWMGSDCFPLLKKLLAKAAEIEKKDV